MARTAAVFRGEQLSSPGWTKVTGITYTGSQQLDVWKPNTSGRPVLGVVHGGGWLNGDKADAGVRHWCNRFADYGFMVASANHSLNAADPQTPITELLALVTWLRANAATYNGSTSKIALLGGSSGAQLVLMAAIQGVAGGSRPDAVIAWSPPSNLGALVGAAATACQDNYMQVAYVGNEAAWNAKSPTLQMSSNCCPIRIVGSSDEDTAVAGVEQSQYDDLEDVAIAALGGENVDKRIFLGTVHGDFGDGLGLGSDDIPASAAWLRSVVPWAISTGTTRAAASGRVVSSGRTTPALSACTIEAAAGDTVVVVNQITAPAGGTPPHTAALYRHTGSFTPPGTGTLLSASASFPYTDTGRTNGVAYYYEVITTDAAAATANSNEVSATPAAASGVAIFTSNWGTATGTAEAAIRDTGAATPWTTKHCSSINVANVIAGGSVGWTLTTNCLEITRRSEDDCTQVSVDLAGLSEAQDYFIRIYIRNDATEEDGSASNHPICINTVGDIQAIPWANWFLSGTAPEGYYIPKLAASYASTGNNYDRRWMPNQVLANATWYRFEWKIEFVALVGGYWLFRMWPRIYNMAGTLLFDSDDYRRMPGFGGGDLTESLTEYYASGKGFVFSDVDLSRNFGVGYEGPSLAIDTGEKWYYAGVKVNTGDWVGGI